LRRYVLRSLSDRLEKRLVRSKAQWLLLCLIHLTEIPYTCADISDEGFGFFIPLFLGNARLVFVFRVQKELYLFIMMVQNKIIVRIEIVEED